MITKSILVIHFILEETGWNKCGRNNGRNLPSEVTENPGFGCFQRGVLTGVSVGCCVIVSGFSWVFSCCDWRG